MDGFNALKALIINAPTGKSKIYKPTMTLKQFFATYALDSDGNNSVAYAKAVGKKLGVGLSGFSN
jgi:hypothetical protein